MKLLSSTKVVQKHNLYGLAIKIWTVTERIVNDVLRSMPGVGSWAALDLTLMLMISFELPCGD